MEQADILNNQINDSENTAPSSQENINDIFTDSTFEDVDSPNQFSENSTTNEKLSDADQKL